MPRGKIEYKGPWGGVNTNVPATYLGPNEFPLLNNIFIYGNELKTRPPFTKVTGVAGLNILRGTLGHINPNGVTSLFEPWQILIGYDNALGQGAVYDLGTGNSGSMANPATSHSADMFDTPVYTNVMYKQVAYWSAGRKFFSYTFTSPGPNVFAIANANYGAMYVSELAEHILLGYVMNNNGDNLNSPTLLCWAGSLNPTVFNPAIDSTAGNQSINRCYCLNGILSNGYSAYLTHPGGVKQITPTGNSTAPFNIQDYALGDFGFGNMFAWSFDGNGQVAFFISGDDVKMLTPYGLQGIGGNARPSLFTDLAGFTQASLDPLLTLGTKAVVGSVIPGFGVKYPYANYAITIPNGPDTILWIYLFNEDKWIRWYLTGVVVGKFSHWPLGLQAAPQQPGAWALYGSTTAAGGGVFDNSDFNTESTSEIDFRVEDQDGKFFQCARIRVTYRDLGVCPVTFSLYNVNEDGTYNNPAVSKTINLGTASADGQIKQVYTDFVATGLFTQLKVTRAANAGACSIIKIQLLEEGADNLEVA